MRIYYSLSSLRIVYADFNVPLVANVREQDGQYT